MTARVLGTPAPGLAVWRSTEDADVVGDLDDAPAEVRSGDLLVLEVRRVGFRWLVQRLVDHVPAGRPTARTRPPAPHAHPARPPGTVLIAWLPHASDVTPDDPIDESPGKHRPVVVLRSPDPAVVRGRPLYDPASAVARRHGGPRLQAWRAAGLDKPSVAGPAVDVPVGRCEQTLGRLSPVDRALLGLDR